MSKFDLNGDGKVDYKDALAAVKKVLDLNGDGTVNLKDVLWGVGVIGTGTTAAATAGYLTGAALVTATSTAIGSTIAATGGSIAGVLAGTSLGTSTMGSLVIHNLGSVVIVKSAIAQVVNTSVVSGIASVTTAMTVAAEAATGYISGLPIIKSAAVAILQAKGEVIVIAGVPIGIHAAIAAGLVTLVLCAGVVYFLRNQQDLTDQELEELSSLEG
tara:strand:+ start:165 stop:809 length:645 start_codon:yes stop_codon:yes gene_type:complete